MTLETSLIITILFLILITALAYFGCLITFFSSLALATFISLLLLIYLSPLSDVSDSDSSIALAVYFIYLLLSILILALYISITSFNDIRAECRNIC
jgi:hypothetical protein